MSKLTELTAEQQSKLIEYREEAIRFSLSDYTIDRTKFDPILRKLYEPINPDVEIVYCDSLLGGQLFLNLMSRVGNQVWDQVLGQVWDQVSDQVEDQVYNQVRDQAEDQIWDQVWDQVWGQVQNQVRNQIRNQVSDQVEDQILDQVWSQIQGLTNLTYYAITGCYSPMYAFYEFFCKETDVEIGQVWDEYKYFLKHISYIIPTDRYCVVINPFKTVKRNDLGVLHCKDGPCIECHDGFKLWAINGIFVDREIVENPSCVTLDMIEAEENSDMRQVLVEQYGYSRYFQDIGATVVDTDVDIDEIARMLIKTEDAAYLCCACISSKRQYSLRVPFETASCEEASAWLQNDEQMFIVGQS